MEKFWQALLRSERRKKNSIHKHLTRISVGFGNDFSSREREINDLTDFFSLSSGTTNTSGSQGEDIVKKMKWKIPKVNRGKKSSLYPFLLLLFLDVPNGFHSYDFFCFVYNFCASIALAICLEAIFFLLKTPKK